MHDACGCVGASLACTTNMGEDVAVGDGVYVSSCDGHGDGPMALGWACRFDRGRSWRSGRTTGGQLVIIRRNVLDGICRIVLSRGGIVRSYVGSSFR